MTSCPGMFKLLTSYNSINFCVFICRIRLKCQVYLMNGIGNICSCSSLLFFCFNLYTVSIIYFSWKSFQQKRFFKVQILFNRVLGFVMIKSLIFLLLSSFFFSFLTFLLKLVTKKGFPGGSDGKESACNIEDFSLIPGLGRAPGRRDGYPLQCSCLGNPMDRGA